MNSPQKFTAIVLAGSRRADDPVAVAAGVAHKALARVDGMTMLGRVLGALRHCEHIAKITVVAEDPNDLGAVENLDDLARENVLATVEAAQTPSRSVLRAMRHGDARAPFLVVTADHALLTREMLDHFCAGAAGAGDVAVGLAARTVLEAAYPKASRTYLSFSDDDYSGCNLFAMLTPDAIEAAEFWKRVESQRKKPWKLVRVFGIGNLFRYLFRRLDLERAMKQASGVIGLRVHAVRMPMAEAAIDVDKPEDLVLAEDILRKRRNSA
ncbi:MAG: NTP transferase domain-containing protein [Sphingomonadales bacterium]